MYPNLITRENLVLRSLGEGVLRGLTWLFSGVCLYRYSYS
jgi:hypothetical protein